MAGEPSEKDEPGPADPFRLADTGFFAGMQEQVESATRIGKATVDLHVAITTGDRPFRAELIALLEADAASIWPHRRKPAIARLVALAKEAR